jgi:hypothetical protein
VKSLIGPFAAFLDEAGDQLRAVGHLQDADELGRYASVAALTRAAAERSLAVVWIFEFDDSDRTQARAALS